MAKDKLKAAYIKPVNGARKGQTIPVLYNPAEYSIEKGNTFQRTSLPGLATPVTQFVTGNADTLTMELFFDTYAPSLRHAGVIPREDVRKYTQQVAELLDVDSGLHSPPICEFHWGPDLGSPGGTPFKATIEKLTQRFTMFLDDGTPVRATLNVTFKEYKSVKEQLQEIGRESVDRTKRRRGKEDDSLWLYAAREYDDPAEWRAIADENELENPRRLESGTELALPPLE